MAILEVCANSFQSAADAEIGAAHRIELCQNLEAGGITPSIGLITTVKRRLKIPTHVLIRPRAGDFNYDDNEYETMLEDIQACKRLACEGVVIGILTNDNRVDIQRVSQLVRAAKPMPVTFHRAFDDCDDQLQALEDVIQAGCVRILTSGGCISAEDGILQISKLVTAARGRVTIMPGAGITAHNLELLIQSTAATEYHASAKVSISDARPSKFQTTHFQTDVEQVKALVKVLANAGI